MASLSLNNIRTQKVKSDRLFLDRFEYCFRFRVKDVSVLRISRGNVPSRADVEKIIASRKKWRLHWEEQNAKNKHVWGLPMSHPDPAITAVEEDQLFSLLDYFHLHKKAIKYSVSGNMIYVYSNEYSMLTDLVNIAKPDYVVVKQAIITRPKDTVAHKEPKYRFRTYFKDSLLQHNTKDALRFQLSNAQDIKISKSLEIFLTDERSYIQRYYFIDHNDDKWLLMLHMACPGIIRKTMPIIQAK